MSPREKFYQNLFDWVKSAWLNGKEARGGRPLMIGVSAPQGAGKTTLTRTLCERLKAEGHNAVAVSIDDFYLTNAEQKALAARELHNPYLQQRGYPGTHDISLGEGVLHHLRDIEHLGEVRVPSYDKSAHRGQGDRRPEAEWPVVRAPLEVVFLEGWMLGFPQANDAELAAVKDEHLRAINACLGDYQHWLGQLDAFIWLEAKDPRSVLRWRVEAEERMKVEGKPGMSLDEITAYIAKFLPAYEFYVPLLRARAAELQSKTPFLQSLHLVIGENRLPEAASKG